MLPIDFLDSMRQELGSEADLLFRALEEDNAVTSIRLNDKKEEVTFDCDFDEVPWHWDGYYLSGRPQFTLDPLFHAGCYYVQEASSMFIQQALEAYVAKDSKILDLCAAPGGKSTLISQYIGEFGLLISNEVNRQRVFILSENIQKWGNGNTIVTHNEAAAFGDKCRNLFDCILVDAPCSGEGMFRKDHQAREEWSLSAVTKCAERQRSIIMDVWDALRPGGVMIYSTCTFNRHENEENVLWMTDCLNAEVLPIPYDPEWGITEGQVGYHFYPHRTHGEGLYVCALRKAVEDYAPFRPKLKPQKAQKGNPDYVTTARKWLNHPDQWTIRQSDRFLTAYPKQFAPICDYFSQEFTCISTGFGLGEERGKNIAPQHALAMSKAIRVEAFPRVNLTYEEALRYLRSEALILENIPLGIVLLTYEDVPLGFAKNVGNRLNNLYPNEWRIRHL